MLSVSRHIDAPADAVWKVLVDTDAWPKWGPTVSGGEVDGGVLTLGATGRVRTPLGVALPFTITEFEDGRRWAWSVAGVRHRARCPTGQQWLPREHERAVVGTCISPRVGDRLGANRQHGPLAASVRDARKFVVLGCFDGFMTSATYPSCTGNVASERLEVLFGELAELAGQRNAFDAAGVAALVLFRIS